MEVFEGFLELITQTMYDPLMKDITEKELSMVVTDMAKEKARGKMGYRWIFFKSYDQQ